MKINKQVARIVFIGTCDECGSKTEVFRYINCFFCYDCFNKDDAKVSQKARV